MTRLEDERPDWFDKEVIGAHGRLLSFALSLTQKDHATAEELVQETMERAFRKWMSFQPGTNMVGWLFTILRNEFYSRARKRKREVEDPDSVHAMRMTSPAGQESVIELAEVRDRMRYMPPDQRDAVLLVAVEGYSYEQAAEMLGAELGTIKSRVSRGRAFLEGREIDFEEEAVEEESLELRVWDERRLRVLYAEGASVSEIARDLGIDRTKVMELVVALKLKRVEPV